jgi:RNA polymerase sigma-70 factor (ECF subfamily)
MTLPEKQELFAREYPDLFDFLYRFIQSRLFDREEADDVVSEAVTKAYSQLERFDPERGNLRQWLTGIAKYELLTHWRRKKPTVSLEFEERVPDPKTGEAFTETLDQTMLAEKIYADLPAETKTLVALRYVDDMTYEEMAEVTGKEAPALRQFFSRLHRTLKLEFQEAHD